MSTAVEVARTNGYTRALARLRARYGVQVASAWDAMPSHHEQDVARFVAAVDAATETARQVTARTTAAYLAGMTRVTVPVPVDALRPVDVEVWRDPFISTWANLDAGAPLDAALAAGRDRALSTSSDIVHRADRDAARSVASRNPRIVGWTWTPSADACDWCLQMAAVDWGPTEEALFSTRHGHCACSVVPRTG